VTEIIVLEIQKTFDFFRASTSGEHIEKIYLRVVRRNPGLLEALRQEFFSAVEVLNPFQRIAPPNQWLGRRNGGGEMRARWQWPWAWPSGALKPYDSELICSEFKKAKGKRGSPTAAAATLHGEGGSILVKALAAMIAIAIINGGYWFVLDKQKRDIETQIAGGRTQEPRVVRRQGPLHGASTRSGKLQAPRRCHRSICAPIRPVLPAS